MYFGTKSYLKSNRNHTAKHALSECDKKIYFKIKNTSKVYFHRIHSTVDYKIVLI
jgi:hypothetical protein